MEEEILALIPSLKGRAKKAVRILPQQGEEPGVNATKLGGSFLWPQDEPWFNCDVHEVALNEDYNWNYNPHEINISTGHHSTNIWSVFHPKHNDVFVTVLQIRFEDIPSMRFPEGKNIFQLLWCPRNHLITNSPLCRTVWRNENDIKTQLDTMPQSSYPDRELTPSPSMVLIQEVMEYPKFWALSSEERNLLTGERKEFYWNHLSTNKGIKVGGHPHWIQDPEIPVCKCDNEMEHLLTIGSDVFEDYPNHKAPGLIIGDCGAIYVFICYNCQDFPFETVFQCS